MTGLVMRIPSKLSFDAVLRSMHGAFVLHYGATTFDKSVRVITSAE